MSASTSAPAAPSKGFLVQNHFWLRRLHSLSGMVPIGAFLCFHLFTNAQLALGTYQHEVNWIHSQPAVLMMEIGLIWLPIAFHAALGVWYAVSGTSYGVAKNGGWSHRAYIAQRVTGFVALAFIVLHIATLRWRWNLPGYAVPFFTHGLDPETNHVVDLATASVANALRHPLAVAIYLVGALATVYHFANGVRTFAITWGLTTSVAAMRRSALACAGLGALLTVFTLASLVGAVAHKITESEARAYGAAWDIYRTTGHILHATEVEAPTVQITTRRSGPDGKARISTYDLLLPGGERKHVTVP